MAAREEASQPRPAARPKTLPEPKTWVYNNRRSENVSQSKASQSPPYQRPLVAPNGKPWPTESGYVPGYKHLVSDGRSRVTVDNSRSDSDVLVKLVSIDDPQPLVVRVFFIKSGEQFIIEDVRTGRFDIRYRDLESGSLWRSEPFHLKEFSTTDGVSFSHVTITLYKFRDGNMRTYAINEAEF
jgi:hypothetical protein